VDVAVITEVAEGSFVGAVDGFALQDASKQKTSMKEKKTCLMSLWNIFTPFNDSSHVFISLLRS
jgi:hypothetical protein